MSNITAQQKASKQSYFAGTESVEDLRDLFRHLLINLPQILSVSIPDTNADQQINFVPLLTCNRIASTVDLKAPNDNHNVETDVSPDVNAHAKSKKGVLK